MLKKTPLRKSTPESKSLVVRKKSDTEKRKSSRVHLGRMHLDADYTVEPEPEPEGKVSVYDFLKSSSTGALKAMTKFLEDGGDVNIMDECHRTALHLAALYCKPGVVEFLLQKGANPNLTDKLKNSPLHWACRGGSLDVVQLLLDGGAKVNVKDELCVTPLHVAVRIGFGEVVEYLIDCGAKINAKDMEGDTPSHDAIRLGRQKIVRTLIVRGADLQIKNQEGKTAVDMVQSWYKDTKDSLDKAADDFKAGTNNEESKENKEAE